MEDFLGYVPGLVTCKFINKRNLPLALGLGRIESWIEVRIEVKAIPFSNVHFHNNFLVLLEPFWSLEQLEHLIRGPGVGIPNMEPGGWGSPIHTYMNTPGSKLYFRMSITQKSYVSIQELIFFRYRKVSGRIFDCKILGYFWMCKTLSSSLFYSKSIVYQFPYFPKHPLRLLSSIIK